MNEVFCCWEFFGEICIVESFVFSFVLFLCSDDNWELRFFVCIFDSVSFVLRCISCFLVCVSLELSLLFFLFFIWFFLFFKLFLIFCFDCKLFFFNVGSFCKYFRLLIFFIIFCLFILNLFNFFWSSFL